MLASFNWDARWGQPAGPLGASFAGDLNEPPTEDVFRQARRWARVQRFVTQTLWLRAQFYNHGLLGQREVLVDPKKPKGPRKVETHPGIRALNEGDAPKLEDWKRRHDKAIAAYVRDAWQEFLTLDNLITVWRKGGAPLVQKLERCAYSDAMAIEEVRIRHGLRPEVVEKLNLPEAVKKRLGKPELVLREGDAVFGFDVVKREPVGMGLGWPALAGVFHACAIIENLEVSDRSLSDAMRTIFEQHQLGHEIKNGPHAGSPVHFIKPKRVEAVKKLKGQKGHVIIATNFDHKILLGAGLPDPNRFDSRRFEGAVNHLAYWGMPLAQMFLGKSVNPFLMSLLAEQAKGERELMRPHFVRVFREALGCPVEIRVQWDDAIFWDSRLLLDLLKAGLNGGPLSQETFRERTGFPNADELARKENEAELDITLKAPAWDPNHGKRPGDDKGGKPAGKNDLT